MAQRIMFVGAVTIFLLLLVPYFQNIKFGIVLYFFGSLTAYHTAFWFFILGGMILGALITLLVQGFIQDVKERTSKNKFDM